MVSYWISKIWWQVRFLASNTSWNTSLRRGEFCEDTWPVTTTNLRAAAGIGDTNPSADCNGCICNNYCGVSLAWNWYGMTKMHLQRAPRASNTLMSWVGHRTSHTWRPLPSCNQPQWRNENNEASSEGMSKAWRGVWSSPTRGQCFFHRWLLFTPPGTKRSEKKA